jgi:hypothetical protein
MGQNRLSVVRSSPQPPPQKKQYKQVTRGWQAEFENKPKILKGQVI